MRHDDSNNAGCIDNISRYDDLNMPLILHPCPRPTQAVLSGSSIHFAMTFFHNFVSVCYVALDLQAT